MSSIPPLLVAMALVTVCGVLVLAPVLYRRELTRWVHRWRDRTFPGPERPHGRPIELLVRDLRRVRSDLLAMSPGTPMARRVGITQAYDELLGEACQALGLDDPLADAPAHRRGEERRQVEEALDRAGIPLGR